MTSQTNNSGDEKPSNAAPVAHSDQGLPESKSTLNACPIVGIGASAGGIEALSKFLDHLAADTGAAFVILLHSDPNRKSYAVELYSRHTPMPVGEAENGIVPQPNHVYVAPAGAILTIEAGTFRLRPAPTERGHTIDPFFVSLAIDRVDNAIAVVLSGTGSDGTLGAKAVKEHGGLTMAQSEGSAQHFEMPASAIATGLIDIILPVEELPGRLSQLLRFNSPQDPLNAEKQVAVAADANQTAIVEILEALRAHTGHDFSLYKQGTIGRRIRRRMQLLNIADLKTYQSHLSEHADEMSLLHSDLLIGVTRFFRDPGAFESLCSLAIAPLLAGKTGGQTLKIWIAGCSTGEEAYSIAILVAEELAKQKLTLNVQIFATDLDAAHLAIARAGIYPATIRADVSQERLERYFLPFDGGYQIASFIREMLIFSVHNLLRDPPFSKLDLLSCRNVLIYFRSELQKQLLPIFHYALRDGGFLFLGPSENVSGFAEIFSVVDAKCRLFARKPGSSAFPAISLSRPERSNILSLATIKPARSPVKDLLDQAERVLLDFYSPAAVVIDDDANIVRFLGRTGKYIEPAPGIPEMNLLAMARPGLRSHLRGVLHEAKQRNMPLVVRNVTFDGPGSSQSIDLMIRPIGDAASGCSRWLVVFQDIAPSSAANAADSEGSATAPSNDPAVNQLETELRRTREDLKTSIEDLEISNEELRSSNEEFLSVNEELQSTVEELETSKEELQSVNEELSTVNTELSTKVEQLASAHSDIEHLLESTQIPTIFLDAELKIRTFTGAATSIFTLIPGDVGRPITDLQLRLDYTQLAADARTVLRTHTLVSRKVLSPSGATFDVRILPYHTADGRITGVVISFIDVTSITKGVEDAARLAAVTLSSSSAIAITSLDGKVLTWNSAAERLYGYSASEVLGKDMGSRIVAEPHHAGVSEMRARLLRGETIGPLERKHLTKDGREIDVVVSVVPVPDAAGNVTAFAYSAHDVTNEKRSLQLLRESEEQFRTMIDQAADGIFVADLQGRYTNVNAAGCDMLGYSREELLSMSIADIVVPQERPRTRGIIEQHRDGRRTVEEWKFLRKDGSTFDGEVSAKLMSNGLLLGLLRDVSEHKKVAEQVSAAYQELGLKLDEQTVTLSKTMELLNTELANRARVEHSLRESQSRLGVVFDTAAEGIITINQHGIIDAFNPAAERLFGYSADEVVGRNVSILMPPPDKERHDGYLKHYLATGEKKVIGIGREVTGLRSDGSTFPMDLAIGEGIDGEGPLFTGIVRDLTARKMTENQLRTSERLVAIGTLAAGLGHDMNNVLLPVRAHLDAIDAIIANRPSAAPKRRHIAAVRKSVTYLQQLADSLHFLSLDPDTDGDARGGGTTTNLHSWWQQAGGLLKNSAAKHVTLTADFPKRLPNAAISSHALTQAILNLIVNANEAIPRRSSQKSYQGKVHLWAKVHKDSAGEWIQIGVTDNGVGMSEETKRRAFEVFFTTKPRGLGTGLGLALVRKVAIRAGGSIELQSTLNKGTSVILVVPAVSRKKNSKSVAKPVLAAVTLRDGRAAGLITHMLSVSGATILNSKEPASAQIWVVDAGQDLAAAKAWRKGHSGGRLVLFGKPPPRSASAWKALSPIVITDPNDFEQIRTAISHAISLT